MTYREVLLLIHILAAITWLGGGIMAQILAFRIVRSGDPARTVAFSRDMEFFGGRVFMPAAIVLAIAGILMVIDIEVFAFGDAWIIFGLAVIAFSAVLGAAFLTPEGGRIAAIIENRGVEDREVQDRINRIILASRVELLLLLSAVYAMVFKPGG